MSASSRVRASSGSPLLVGLFAICAGVLGAAPAQAQPQLSFFKNYFVTGDYTVRGVSLWRRGVNGRAVAQIPALGIPAAGGVDGVPTRADIVAAFLYVQTAERTQGSGVDYLNVHMKFNGQDFGPFVAPGSTEPGSGTLAKALNWEAATPPCWSVAYPGGRRLVTYRADVLRFLPIDPATGKQSLTATHRVEVPDWGFRFKDDDEGGTETEAESGPRAIGASLVVIYRDRSQPLRGIVLYDGGVTKRANATLEQRLEGFYQSLTGGTTAKLTHVVGDGRLLLSERVRSAGLKDGVAGPVTTALNGFRSGQGPKWDNWSSAVPLPSDADAARVRVEPYPLVPDCLSWSAMVLSTAVQDEDDDGLLDVWETESNLVDPTGQPLPNLPAMGASPVQKDMFVEIAYMHALNGATYGDQWKDAHSHLPSHDALKRVGRAFQARGIRVHFDVGSLYQDPPAPGETSYIVPAAHAKGGKSISETLACTNAQGSLTECLVNGVQAPLSGQFPLYPGTVGWKTGYTFVKEELGFERTRKDMFRYALFAHFIGMPKDPCFRKDAQGNYILDSSGFPESDPQCGLEPDSEFHIPRTNSGIADFPGGDMLITLGAFDNSAGLPIGTDYMQAATLMHEMGHNFELTHAGPPQIPREPNCKPNYLSVMNYLFQLRGLLDATGSPQLDYSDNALSLFSVTETGLTDAPFPSAVSYRTGWYAPLATSYLNGFAPAATKHCDGSDLLVDANGLPTEPLMVRVDSLGLAGQGIDWNANGTLDAAGVPVPGLPGGTQDVNFNGETATLNPAAEDWSAIRLAELGGRRSPGAFFKSGTRYFMGPMSLDVGRGDIGRGDIGRGDIGRGDIGRGDIGRGDIGRGDIGRGDIGRGDIGRGDIGRGDIGRGDIGRGDFGGGDMDVGAPSEFFNGELDFETFIAATGNAPTPANTLQACLTTGEASLCAVEGGGNVPVRLNWQPPNVGRPVGYEVYRFTVNPESAFPPATLPSLPIGSVFGGEDTPLTTYVDRTAVNGVTYAYYVVALFDDEQRSGISNFAVLPTPAGQLPPPVLLTPTASGPAIAQNNRATECSLLPGPNASRGRGYMIAFDWEDVVSPSGVSGYRLVATRVGATLPIVDQVVQSSQFTHLQCNSFVEDENLTGWEWRVQTQDARGQLSEWSAPMAFQFAPCLLDDGETSCHVPEPPFASGGITDPSGDAGVVIEGPPNPDLISASVVVQEEFVELQVRFAPGSFHPATAVVQFSLDTDQNVETGHRGTDSGCSADNGQIGVEYIVDFGAGWGEQATIVPYVGPACNAFGGATQSGPGTVTYVTNGVNVVFPRSLLGEDDGFLNFKAISYRFLGNGFTGPLDRVTDAGLAPGVVIGR